MDIEKLSLNERITGSSNTQSDAEKANVISKQPLSEKLRQIEDGEIFNDTDTFPYIRDMKRSANIPLYRMVTDHKIYEVNSELHKSMPYTSINPIDTYGELAWMSSYTRRITMAKENYLLPIDDIKDGEFEIFILLGQVLLGEYRRRTRVPKSEYQDIMDISSLFPALKLPLPMYFKASAECCKDEEWKNYISTLYKEVYSPFLRKDEAIKDIVRNCMSSQPVKDTGYCDPVTMMAVLRIADEDKIISTNEWLDMTYDIVITPFLFCKPS